MRNFHPPWAQRRGGGLVVALVTLLIVTMLLGSVVRSLLVELRQSRQEANALQASWLADAGLARAAAMLAKSNEYTGERWKLELGPHAAGANDGVAFVDIQVDSEQINQVTRLTVVAIYPDDPVRRARAERVVLIPHQLEKSPASRARPENNP